MAICFALHPFCRRYFSIRRPNIRMQTTTAFPGRVEAIRPTSTDFSPSSRPLMRERAVFVLAFQEAYREVPLAALHLATSGDVQHFLNEQFDNEVHAFLSDERAAHRFYRAVCRESGDIVGYLSLDIGAAGQSIYMRQFAVHPDFQRKGVGSAMFSKALNDFPDAREVTVAYRAVNKGAYRFYRQLGFVETEDSPLDSILYRGMRWIATS